MWRKRENPLPPVLFFGSSSAPSTSPLTRYSFQFIKPYFKEFDDKNVNISLQDSTLKLSNLEFNKDFLQLMGLNMLVLESRIQEFSLTIPWRNLSKSVINERESQSERASSPPCVCTDTRSGYPLDCPSH